MRLPWQSLRILTTGCALPSKRFVTLCGRWPDAEIRECDWLLDDNPERLPAFMIAVHRKRP